MIIRKKLSNGITVLHEPRNLPLVSLSISNPFGASFEESKIKGIAHFIEHLVFTGTKTRTHEQISREIEKKGGILNAFTSHDVTSFWFKLPSEHLFSGLDILTDILNNPLFEKEKFEKEKRVVLEEIKMYHDAPQYHIFEQIEKNLYESPFGETIIGNKETISSLERDFTLEFFKKHYSPENFIVTIVGQADLDSICKYLEKTFAPKNLELSPIQPKKHNKETTEERPGIDQAHFILAFHAPKMNTKTHYALQVLDAYLANGMSSRLFLEIREKRGPAYTVKSTLNTEKNFSYYTIYVGTTKSALEEVKSIILEEFKKASEELTEKNLEEAKQQLIGQKKITSEESSSVMNDLLFHEIADKAEAYYEFEKQINSITLEDVKQATKISSYSTAAIVPK